jgi:nucleoside-diphosphate kinase
MDTLASSRRESSSLAPPEDGTANSVHSTDSDGMKPPQIFVERTLAIIKPDAVDKTNEIEDIILRSGFTILNKRRVHLTPEQVSEFYAEHFGKLFFPSLVAYMSSGPVVAMVLAREKAVAYWRQLIGPTNAAKARETDPDSLRAHYGTDEQRNGLHGSDSLTSSERESRFFFAESIVEPVPRGQLAKDYLNQFVTPTLLRALTELCRNKPEQPVLWLADWLIENNPNKPSVRPESATPLVSNEQ